MKRKIRKFQNFILKAVAWFMAAVFILSCCSLDTDSYLPFITGCVSIGYLALFAYVNGLLMIGRCRR